MKNIVGFNKLEYVRPDFDKVNEKIKELAKEVEKSKSIGEIKEIILKFENVYCNLHTNLAIAMIRAYLDSSDKYYAIEMQEGMQKEATIKYNEFYNALLNSPLSKEIDNLYGEQYLIGLRDNIILKAKGTELIVKEQELICQYQQLKATIKVEYNGEIFSEGEMIKYTTNKDRNVRKESTIALHKAFINLKDKFDNILEQLIAVRNEIAEVNGFSSFADYMNLEKGRHGYGQKELLEFCKNVKEELVDFSGMLNREQAKRLGLDELTSYDSQISFLDGNAKPIGNGEELREKAKKCMKIYQVI